MRFNRSISQSEERGNRALPASPRAGGRLFLLMTSSQWLFAGLTGLILALILFPFYRLISPELSVPLFILGITIVHLRYASHFIIPFPHMILAIVILQYILAVWLSCLYPPTDPLFMVGEYLPEYLKYAIWSVVASAIGLGLGMARLRPVARVSFRATPELLRSLDGLIITGIVGLVIAHFTNIRGLGFIFVLLSNLRYVGIYGRMLCKGRGWAWRMGLILMLEMVFAASDAMFHDLILWLFCTVALWIFVYTPSWRLVLGSMAVAFLMLLPLQQAKWQMRDYPNAITENSSAGQRILAKFDRTFTWFSYLVESIPITISGKLDKEFVGDMVSRYNQGWIISRVMQHVPNNEPYARGETVKNAIISALVPRLIFSDKAVTGGQLNMEKYADIKLAEGVSMNLGFAGEMYANFGCLGGVIGCGFYCLAFALLFRAICIRAFYSPLWWAIVPYIGLGMLKAEDDVVGSLNWLVKSCVVLIGVGFVFPAFRQSLFQKPRRMIFNSPSSESPLPESERRAGFKREA